ncbi:hypothetical protein IFM89_025849 [Coptis chinensis]|uniref:Uncharacterized protein n=1 Tax=Coptis chinensis TaxID=261450 RepID=A0A835I1N8_9MAGN|nr:hypothetical protein IFM89_025849 [Coptis chinensis]
MDKEKHIWNVNAEEFVPRAKLGYEDVSRGLMDPHYIVRESYNTKLNNCNEIREWATEDDLKNILGLAMQFRGVPIVLLADIYCGTHFNVPQSVHQLKKFEVSEIFGGSQGYMQTYINGFQRN